jgi:hypothetical protein
MPGKQAGGYDYLNGYLFFLPSPLHSIRFWV